MSNYLKIELSSTDISKTLNFTNDLDSLKTKVTIDDYDYTLTINNKVIKDNKVQLTTKLNSIKRKLLSISEELSSILYEFSEEE